tara:strand:- start:675 stop:1103 length:429 start_codon:yes stop_codon:yes gene_type:complete
MKHLTFALLTSLFSIELFSSSDVVTISPDLFLECQPDTDLMPEWYAIDEKQKQVVIYKFWQPLMPIYADSQKFRIDDYFIEFEDDINHFSINRRSGKLRYKFLSYGGASEEFKKTCTSFNKKEFDARREKFDADSSHKDYGD